MLSKDKLIALPSAALVDGDSILSYLHDGTGNALTSTSGALNVQIQNASLVVTATDLDIRNLVFATDKVDVSGSSNVAVVGTDFDIRDLSSATDSVTAILASTHAEDSAHSSGASGQFVLAVRNDAGVSLVGSDGDYSPFSVDASGNLRVAGTLSISGQYAEDSSHVSGSIGIYNLAVRSDSPVIATSADGDYASQTTDAYNRSWVNTGANVSISNGAATVTTTGALLVAASAGRRKILIQNLGNKAVYFGAAGVSSANGIKLSAGGNTELELGPALALHTVAESGSQDIRYLQLS